MDANANLRSCACVRLLIDGYNLLHQSPVMGRNRGKNWLEQARHRLVGYLASLLNAAQRKQTMIVFDASRRRSTTPDDETLWDIRVIYAIDHQEADDLVEKIVRQHPTPRLLTVVSSDHRLQRCARARRATAIDCDAWLAQLESAQRLSNKLPAVAKTEIDKPEIDAVEVVEYLQEFGFRLAKQPARNSMGVEQNTHATQFEISQPVIGSNTECGSAGAGQARRPRTKRMTSTADRQRAKTEVTQVLPILPDSSRLADPSS